MECEIFCMFCDANNGRKWKKLRYGTSRILYSTHVKWKHGKPSVRSPRRNTHCHGGCKTMKSMTPPLNCSWLSRMPPNTLHQLSHTAQRDSHGPAQAWVLMGAGVGTKPYTNPSLSNSCSRSLSPTGSVAFSCLDCFQTTNAVDQRCRLENCSISPSGCLVAVCVKADRGFFFYKIKEKSWLCAIFHTRVACAFIHKTPIKTCSNDHYPLALRKIQRIARVFLKPSALQLGSRTTSGCDW